MARPERPLDLSNPIHAFAAELRKLRGAAGDPKYLTMARKVGGISKTALSEAAGGDHLPTWRTVEKFVLACGGDPDEWRGRWENLSDQLKQPVEQQPSAGSAIALPDETPAMATVQRATRSRVLVGVIVGGLAAVAIFAIAQSGITGSGAPGHGARSAAAAAAVPTGPAVVVQNMIAVGQTALIEDSDPAYLSTRPVPRCRLNGCMIPDTILKTGTAVVATCQLQGTWMTNFNLDSTEVRSNPHRAESTLWYRLVLPDGRAGSLSEVYVTAASRGGLNLPTCAPDVPVSTP
jgi:hypothetical protein